MNADDDEDTDFRRFDGIWTVYYPFVGWEVQILE